MYIVDIRVILACSYDMYFTLSVHDYHISILTKTTLFKRNKYLVS